MTDKTEAPAPSTGATARPAASGAVAGDAPAQAGPRPFKYDRKAYDPWDRAFHRLRSPTYDQKVDGDPDGQGEKRPPSGRGYDCGCRSPTDYQVSGLLAVVTRAVVHAARVAALSGVPGANDAWDNLQQQASAQGLPNVEEVVATWLAQHIEGPIFADFLPSIPSWAPVNRIKYGPEFALDPASADPLAPDHPLAVHNVRTPAAGQKATQEREVEVEGRLTRSFMTRHHRPYTQWERYRHWAFHVEPAHGFRHLVGQGDRMKQDERTKHKRALRLYEREHPDQHPSSIECLIDPATFSRPPGDRDPFIQQYYPSIFYDKRWPFWPQTGDWFWAAGRFVYDCTHATFERTTGDNPGLHATAINPIKAFAVARYEAFRFPGLDLPVPAVRFLFFATRRGGYWDFDRDMPMNEADYEFAVDLPPLPNDTGEFAIGRTPAFKYNTVVVRPRLLKDVAFGPFDIPREQALDDEQGVSPARRVSWWNGDPVVELSRAAPGTLPRMVKVKVPTSKMPTTQDFYCFVLTLGWHSPSQAARVKKVAVQLPYFRFLDVDRVDQLRPSICINGRWIYYPIFKPVVTQIPPLIGPKVVEPYKNVQDGRQDWPGKDGLILEMPVDAKVTITAHGTRRNGHGEFIEHTPSWHRDSSKDRRLFVGGVIDLDEDTAEFIRAIIRTRISDIIPMQYWQDHPDVIDALDNDTLRDLLSQASQDLIGQRRLVEWTKDVDAAGPDTNNTHAIASAVAREMRVFPIGSADQPMGFIDGPPAGTRAGLGGAPLSEQDEPEDLTTTRIAMLVQGNDPSRPYTANYQAVVTEQTDHTAYTWFSVKNKGKPDYGLDCKITVSDPEPSPEGGPAQKK
ncbi:MAG: hypothetical protein ACJ78X_13015 [Myxococcales bacterium]